MYWSGIEPGDSKALAVSERIRRRFERLLEVIALDWAGMELMRFPYAQYRADGPDVLIPILGRDGKEDPDLFLLVEFLPHGEDAETYLLVEFKSERRKTAKALVEEVARRRGLRMPGLWSADPGENEWLVRALALSRVEVQPQDSRLAQITEFIKETVLAVEESGLLDIELPRKKTAKE